MFLALHLPALPLEAILRHQPQNRLTPCATVSSPRNQHQAPHILHPNRRATAQGVRSGLSITRALARCPDLALIARDPEAEIQAFRDLLTLTESLTPDFELTTPDTLILDLHRTSTQATESLSRTRLPPLGLPAQFATAPTPDLAHLFALSPATSHALIYRGPEFRWKAPRHPELPLLDQLDLLPLQLIQQLPSLQIPTATIELFEPWGIRHLGDLARLPRKELSERLGPSIHQLHALLLQDQQRLLHTFKPLESFVSCIHLEHSLENCESLIFKAKRILQTLVSRANSNYRFISEVHLKLILEKPPEHHYRVRLPEPSNTLEVLLRPLATHLEQLTLGAPVTGLEISLTPCEPPSGQHDLFERGVRQPHRLADTLVRLAALLGEDHIGFPRPHFTHRPDSFDLTPPQSLFQRPSPPPAHFSTDHFSLPLQRFRPPPEVAVASEKRGRHPHPLALLTGPHRGQIAHLHGPFPLSGEWWNPDKQWQHLEWDLQLDSGHLLRLAHHPPKTWQLQGRYS
ncbi:hypothetical protein [Haloferula rosea]|uniref:UmuC domain-containing protein n=1 Tax=Haloferula rosea TaxID=490093 RepID=A0A934RB95_9BACT|nr:hypothetical protein [Haloferula rosea]MBK1825821.1 hypothetical protein [Haloferula rosea]